jgi:hypothetical protein
VSSALLESAAAGRLFSVDAGRREPQDGPVTLEERLDAAWRTLQASGAAECPLCRGRLRGHDGGCEGCGSRLG